MRIALLLASAPDSLPEVLALRGHRVTHVGHEADPTSPPIVSSDLIVVDVELAERVDLIGKVTAAAPGIELVLVGPSRAKSHPDVLEHIERPIDVNRLCAVVDELAAILDRDRLREPVDLVAYETVFAGDSPAIRELLRRVRLVSRSDEPVWIYGDDGSGRSIIARAIHDRSPRRGQPFIAFNTAAHADEDLAKRVFHGESAAVVAARSGTLFLERIAVAGPETQRELTRYLETRDKDGTSPRLIVGVQRERATDPAEHPLENELFFRLKVLEVEIPRLADRTGDLAHIVPRMLERLSPTTKPAIASDTMKLLERYPFPGNLLELAHALTHAFVLAAGAPIQPNHLPLSIRRAALDNGNMLASPAELEALDIVAKRFEREYLLQVLRNVDGNRGRAAEILGLSRKGLWGKLKAHGISDDDIDQEEP
ncbi:MAG TPA: sigma 54-interacting transcriptional regulator [Kofleriaceae bacterium]